MSSSDKTSLGLNLWLGSDKPKRTDFCSDNQIIDDIITSHTADSVSHTTEDEKENWNNYIYCNVYYGNGKTSRNVALKCPFSPRAVIVFSNGITPNVKDDDKEYVYSAIATKYGSTLGMEIGSDGQSIDVVQSTTAALQNEWCCLNETGGVYCYICLR